MFKMLILIFLPGNIFKMLLEILFLHRFLVMFDLLWVELLEWLVGEIEVEVAGGGSLELREDERGVVLVEGGGGGGVHDFVIKLWVKWVL